MESMSERQKNEAKAPGLSPLVSASGLEGILVAETALSHVDGEAGLLVVAGRDIEDLAAHASFEEALALLLAQAVPGTVPSADGLRALLGRARVRAHVSLSREAPRAVEVDGMHALRGAVAASELGRGEGLEAICELIALVCVASSSWQRALLGESPVSPNPELSHAADYLRMCGVAPHEAKVRAMDRYLVTVMDHGMNASTFAARVVASTDSDALSAVVAGIGALKGPLHGGAPGPVLDMLDRVGTPERAEAWIASALASGQRIMGMGHRIYRVRDPRALVLERGIEALEQASVASGRLALARAVEGAAERALKARHPERPLKCNVEFYTAVLLDALGLDRRAFSPTFAVGRVAGWCAHIEEQRRVGRLIRPASRYVGVMPSR